MQFIRKTVFWLHLVVGLVVGGVIALQAGTGLLMAFEHPIVSWVEKGDGRPTDAKASVLTIEALVRRAVELDPTANPTGITVPADLNQPVVIQYGRDRQVQLNGYTGQPTGTEATTLRSFFRITLELHRWLALSGDWRDAGKAVTGVAAIGFLTLIVSGLWIWFPRKLRWNALKAVLVPGLRLKGKPRDWNWHNVAGFWAMIPLLIITLTALVMSYSSANGLMYRAVGETPPAQRGRGGERRPRMAMNGGRPQRPLEIAGLNDIWDATEHAAKPGWTSINMRFAGGRRGGDGGGGDDAAGPGNGGEGSAGRSFNVTVAYGDPAIPFNRVNFAFARETGELLSTSTFSDQTLGRQLRALTVPIHRGEALGLAGMTIAAMACIAALVLCYTGVALSYRRLLRPVLAGILRKRVKSKSSLGPRPGITMASVDVSSFAEATTDSAG